MRLRLAAALLIFALPLAAQTPAATAPPTHPTSAPYTGDLSVFEDPARAQKLQIDRVMDTLKLRPGSNVADIGAGGGWFSVRAAHRVAGGPPGSGTVYAEDINPHAVDAIHDRATKENLSNIAAVLGTSDNPKLPADTLDAALMLRVYHEVAHPSTLLANLRTAMKPGALFGVIDHPGHGDDHGINADVVIAEVQRNGFRFVKQYDFTKGDQNDYFLVFERP
jgi:predicted methyltransferase